MGTDVHGAIEVWDQQAGPDESGEWVKGIDLWPLVVASDAEPAAYPPFAYLFGIRNSYGFKPLAAGRGLPDDVSSDVRDDLGQLTDAREPVCSWAGWNELAPLELDLAGPFGPYVAWLDETENGGLHRTRMLRDVWSLAEVAHLDPPTDLRERAADGPVVWTHGRTSCMVQPLTLATVFGPGTPWGHLLAVMRTLAGRFGDDGVRVVVAFD